MQHDDGLYFGKKKSFLPLCGNGVGGGFNNKKRKKKEMGMESKQSADPILPPPTERTTPPGMSHPRCLRLLLSTLSPRNSDKRSLE